MIRVLLADDHKMVTDGFTFLLENQSDIKVVADAKSGQEVLEILEKITVDVVVLDVQMPDMNGIETTKMLKSEQPDLKILIVSMYNQASYIIKLIELGVNGYILKDKGVDELIEAVRTVQNGGSYFGKEVTNTLFKSIQERSNSNRITKEVIDLTKRETEVLRLIANGLSTPQIGEKLCIAHSTVETHRRNIIDKTGVANSKALIKWAIRNDYLD